MYIWVFLSIAMNGSIADAVRSCGIMLSITCYIYIYIHMYIHIYTYTYIYVHIYSIADAVRSCGIMLLITAGVQLSLAFNIALSVPSLYESLHICDNHLLVVCISGMTVYVLLMFETFPALIQGLVIALFSRELDFDGRRRRLPYKGAAQRLLLAVIACVMLLRV